jgi:RecA/RadA recombinase
MDTLMGLKIPSVIKINDTTASMRINSEWELKITISGANILYEAQHKGKNSASVPSDVIGVIDVFKEKYTDALEELLEGGLAEHGIKDPINNLKAGGFEIEGDAPEVPVKEPLIESPDEPDDVKQVTPSDAEAKAQDDKEENLRKLAELERIEQQMNEAEERKILEMAKRESIKESAVPKQQIENKQSPASKTPLLDMIFDYVGNDVLEVFGDTGSGKTAFVKKVAYEAAAAGKKVFYLDTERNLTKNDIDLLKKCKYQYTPVIDEIDKVIQTLPAGDVVILDSVGFPVLTTFARMNMKQKGDALLKMIAIFGSLKEWAYKNNGIVLVTNQPESEFNKAPNHILRPFGDKSQFAAKEIWETIKDSSSPDLTKSTIKAFRSRSVGHGKRLATMNINDAGVEVVRA